MRSRSFVRRGCGGRIALPCIALTLLVFAISARANPTVEENQKKGTEDWRLTSVHLDDASGHGLRSVAIEGYASRASLYPGERIGFHVSAAPSADFAIDIYRTGYYNGKGGRHMLRLGNLTAQEQPTPPSGPGRLRECAWPESAELAVPEEGPVGSSD